jgi:Notch-like protein
VANAFNNFFTTVTEKINIQLIEKRYALWILKDSFPGKFFSIKIIPITKAKIKSIIHSLKPKKSSGYDKITSTILKACPSLNSHPLSYINNHLLYTDIFPDCLKIAVVKLLYKKEDKRIMTNYRPMSLLTIFSKVLKSAMHCRLSQHLHINTVLVTEQYSFRKGIPMEDVAFRLTDSVIKSINQKMHVGGTFRALAKAFDHVNHGTLFAKLHF